ncbi:MAG: hypothetical protein A2754_00995 [Candidatus Magasanikbacteria bacterium RIFCSPHIGHO2_01_FULL_47_8]|uniref:PDZ domain-containing protein n=1 Tax=Candidatus Magasanikbacteria bacterium RIFCSPHIGHO2_01_FULL_47_8 TaxID=1798673 RepID=A0A1F6MBH8_9BACT|nr:MAG: hypothetical protein A2754_00995 [Candidatus Magasanikbacteria bacterium RIFCSPHIGHO2_01_FULL_47_8]
MPPPSSNIQNHRRWERLKIVLVASGFGLIAGLSGASIMLGWIWPNSGGDVWSFTRTPSNLSRLQAIERGESGMADKIFTIYQKLTTVNGAGYFAPGDKVADAVVVTSEGWAVAYLPNFDGKYKDWRILGARGLVYRADRAVEDRRSGLVYLKLSPPATLQSSQEQFKVVAFSDGVDRLDDVLVFQNSVWYPSFSLGSVKLLGESHLDTAPGMAYALGTNFKSGAIAVDNQGRFVGFVTKDAVVLPASAIIHVLPGIQTAKNLLYPSLGVEGWFSDERPILANEEQVAGFLVTRVVSAKSALRKGDIIVEVNGRAINSDTLWYNRDETKVRLKVLRAGKPVEFENVIVKL